MTPIDDYLGSRWVVQTGSHPAVWSLQSRNTFGREVPVPAAPETILLVEDEPAIRLLIVTALTRAGYTVLHARHGREALAVFEKHQDAVDLLLTDIRLPYVDGQELTVVLRERRPDLKVLTISGHRPKRLGDDTTFLAKPFTRDELLRVVRAVLDGE